MTEDTRVLIRYRLARAEESLAAARDIVDRHPMSATNRIYYACFYAVSALLLTRGKTSRKHSGTRDLFNIEFIRTGELPLALGKFYGRAFDFRQHGDYEYLTTFEPEVVGSWLEQAERFVAQVSELARKRMEEL